MLLTPRGAERTIRTTAARPTEGPMATWTVGERGQVPGALGTRLMHFCGGFPSFRPVSDRILCLALVLVTQRALWARGETGHARDYAQG